jgi:lysophospholipase L1-like esterase
MALPAPFNSNLTPQYPTFVLLAGITLGTNDLPWGAKQNRDTLDFKNPFLTVSPVRRTIRRIAARLRVFVPAYGDLCDGKLGQRWLLLSP